LNDFRKDRLPAAAFTALAALLATAQLPALPSPALTAAAGLGGVLLWNLRLSSAALFLLTACWALAQAQWRMAGSLPSAWEQRDIRLEGRILGIPQRTEENLRFDLQVEGVEDAAPAPFPPRVRLNWYRTDGTVKAGEHWRLTVRLKRPHGYLNPGGLDYELWLFLQGIRATGYVRDGPGTSRIDPPPSPWNPLTWRQQLFDLLAAALSGHDLAGVFLALTLGEESGITPPQWEVLRRTGTTHLIAVSGSHIGLVAGLVFVATRRLGGWLPLQRWAPPDLAAALSVAAALVYSALAGFSIPTQRALVMVAIVMAAILSRRSVRPLRGLFLALLAVGWYDPFCVLAPGFWLSFAAVAIIVLSLGYRLRPPGWWAGLWQINWLTALGLAPLLLVFFQQVSLVSPVANLIAIPTLGLLGIPLCLLTTLLLALLPAAGEGLLYLTEGLLQTAWQTLEWLARVPLAQWQQPSPPAWTLLFALPGTVVLLAPRGVRGRWLGAVLWLPALTVLPPRPDHGGLRLTLLDVGQGLSAVIRTRSHTLVFDTGARLGKDFDLGTAVVEPFLRSTGTLRIDTLVVSHGDNDHAGGADSLLRRLAVESIYSSVAQRWPRAVPCRAGQRWEWDGVEFAMLGPLELAANDNDNSCVLKVSAGPSCALLTGDIEKPAELRLAERYGSGLRCAVLVAPHHGSNTSSSAEFLALVAPRYGLVPAGYLNRWGFPRAEVLARYRAQGSAVLTSAAAGAITVDMDGSGNINPPRALRADQRHFWSERPPSPALTTGPGKDAD